MSIACSLNPSQLRSRTAEIAGLAREALIAREPVPGGARLAFAPSAETERRLRAIVAAEAECCAFLQLQVSHAPDRLELTITGPEEARRIIDEVFA